MSTMIIVHATIPIRSECREKALELARQMTEATQSEAGCISYTFSTDLSDPGGFHIFEEWESQEALDAHFKAPHMAEFQAKVGKLGVRQMKVQRCEVSSVGPVR